MRAPTYASSTGLRNPRVWLMAALVLAVAASIYLMFVPVVREQPGRLVLDASGGAVVQRDRITLASDQGPWVYLFLLVPVLVAAIPVLRSESPLVAAVSGAALGGLAIIIGVWAGFYYVPSALLMLIGAAMAELEGRPALIDIGGEREPHSLTRRQMTGVPGPGAQPAARGRVEPRIPSREEPEAPAPEPQPAARARVEPRVPLREEPEAPAPEPQPAARGGAEPRVPWGEEPEAPARWGRRRG